MNNALFVGIDVSSKQNVAYIMKPDGDKHSSFSVPNNLPGAEALVDRIVEVLQKLFIPKVVIGMESTSVYGDNLMYFLRETGKLSGFEKKLQLVGVGYRAAKEGNKLVLNIGYSHTVEVPEIDGITIEVPQPNQVVVSGCDKQKVGQFAAEIREKRPPEPYKGKGIKYADEVVRRKVGKTGAKK